MRIFPRIGLPRTKMLVRKMRRWRRHLTVARVVYALELPALGGVLLWLLTGSRATFVDGLGKRTDLAALALTLAAFGLLHRAAKRYFIPWLDRFFRRSGTTSGAFFLIWDRRRGRLKILTSSIN